MVFEVCRQVALIGKAALCRNLNERSIRLLEQASGSRDTLVEHKAVWAFSCRLPEQPGKVRGAETDLRGQVFQGEILAQMARMNSTTCLSWRPVSPGRFCFSSFATDPPEV